MKALEPLKVQLWRGANRLTSLVPPPPFGGRPGIQKKVFIVCSNPVGSSFSNAIADSAEKGLLASGHLIRRINLYSMPSEVGGGEFRSLLSTDERQSYFQENNQPQLRQDKHVEHVVESLKWCDSLVLVYPTWWFNIPAILKGFFDRCFVPGVGFKYDPELGQRTTGLKNIEQVAVITTYGFSWLEVMKAGDAGRRMISGGMRMLFAPLCTLKWLGLYEMQSAQPREVRTEFLEEVEQAFKEW
ncbi:hypothetical protein GUITHDRAFT_89996 [Guillardia theta CCMP2712]|uniref:Flavodoxin-like fold domain-containing protein n=1 Tax=Guillardia theta (strain CCMP2712) TaxID=905079 RepID=L1IJK9_GUITC|nr:hypothetical protein GUITHDRAFT_89996 [Guillardia theta CCMP2712]EKX36421.1 hypothetical protein GUITHDRAFT_89996 [Guillardia theta CCMP2712]|eukprot:XP_005823401.1 hypothetical protein GUITHDRAFT_89996 [Guillardia theta CCMP2712]